jgi:hypothetical protein
MDRGNRLPRLAVANELHGLELGMRRVKAQQLTADIA